MAREATKNHRVDFVSRTRSREVRCPCEPKLLGVQVQVPEDLTVAALSDLAPSAKLQRPLAMDVDPQQADEAISLDELGEGSRNTVLLALLWSYAVDFE